MVRHVSRGGAVGGGGGARGESAPGGGQAVGARAPRRCRAWPAAAPARPRCAPSDRAMEYPHLPPMLPPAPPAPAPHPLPLPSLPQMQLQHQHQPPADDDRWSQYHIWRQHVFVNGQCALSPAAPPRPAVVESAGPIPDAAGPIESSLFRPRPPFTRLLAPRRAEPPTTLF